MPTNRLSSTERESTPLEPAAPHQGHGNPAGSDASGTAGSKGVVFSRPVTLAGACDALATALDGWKRAADLWGVVARNDLHPQHVWTCIDWNLRSDVQAAQVATRIAQLRHLAALETFERLREKGTV